MFKRLGRHLTYANIAATLALALATSGTAYAVATVTGADVVDESLTGADIKGAAPSPGHAAVNGTLTTYDIQNQTIHDADLAPSSVTGAKVADGSLTGADIDLFNDNRCNAETVEGTALINADPAVPNTYTTAWIGYPHSCSGQDVQVRRVGTGEYAVSFGASNPARLAVVTQNVANGVASALIAVEAGPAGLFYVRTTRVNGSYADVDFTITVF